MPPPVHTNALCSCMVNYCITPICICMIYYCITPLCIKLYVHGIFLYYSYTHLCTMFVHGVLPCVGSGIVISFYGDFFLVIFFTVQLALPAWAGVGQANRSVCGETTAAFVVNGLRWIAVHRCRVWARSPHVHTENCFTNLIESNRNQIVFTMHRLILDPNERSVAVSNLLENGKHNLISVWFNKISKRFLSVQSCGILQCPSTKTCPLIKGF